MLIGNQNNMEKLFLNSIKSNLTPKIKCYTEVKQKAKAKNRKGEIETIK